METILTQIKFVTKSSINKHITVKMKSNASSVARVHHLKKLVLTAIKGCLEVTTQHTLLRPTSTILKFTTPSMLMEKHIQ